MNPFHWTSSVMYLTGMVLTYFNPVLHCIQKQVIWSALQIKRLFSIWDVTLDWNGLNKALHFSVADPTRDDDDVDFGGKLSTNKVHIRIQQRNGRKTITTLQGIEEKYDQKKLAKAFKKVQIFDGFSLIFFVRKVVSSIIESIKKKKMKEWKIKVYELCYWILESFYPSNHRKNPVNPCSGLSLHTH